jgi:ubiquinone/menaquinone biosynthesis C-methylase UbiE
MLHNIQPQSLLDIGTGRGVFLWPLLDTFSTLPVTATDVQEFRVADLQAIRNGGIQNLSAQKADVTHLPFDDDHFDVVTALETMEHLPNAHTAIQEVVRVAKRHAIFSVPSKADTNPEHIHVVTQAYFQNATKSLQCTVSFHYVLNHMLVFVTKNL